MKAKHRTPRRRQALEGPWMNVLAAAAAEARSDGGEVLQRLLSKARYGERPRLSLTKHREAA